MKRKNGHWARQGPKDACRLKKAVSILQRFEGSPEFEWVNEIAPLLNDKFGLKDNEQNVMSLETNID